MNLKERQRNDMTEVCDVINNGIRGNGKFPQTPKHNNLTRRLPCLNLFILTNIT